MLSLALGKTLEEIEQMPERHLQEYQIFYQEQPFGLWREDYRSAQIAYILALINRDPKKSLPKLSDFLPHFNKHNEADEDDGVGEYLTNR